MPGPFNMQKMKCEDCFYGSVTVGERGQIVIPVEARADLGIEPGDKILVMRHPMNKGLMLAKFEVIDKFMNELKSSLVKARSDSGEKE